MSMLFHSNIYNVKKLFSLDFGTNEANLKEKHIFNIPFYQREYVWNEDNATKLIQDISNAQNGHSEQYFLGGIVLCAKSITKEDGYIDVVDGQQRIMTITILLSVLYNFLQKKKNIFINKVTTSEQKKAIADVYDNNYSKIKDLIVENKSSLSMGTQSFFKVNATESINQPFMDFIKYAVDKNEKSEYNDIYQYEVKACYNNKKTCENLTKVSSALYEYIDSNYTNIESINDFIDFLEGNLLFVVTITDDLDTAFQIFETLNDRGVSLSPDDLIKSYIIKNSTESHENHSKKWEEFLSELKDKQGKYLVKPIDFFDWVFMSKGESLHEDSIFSSFRDYCEKEEILTTDEGIDNYLDLLISYAKYYKESGINHPGLKKISFNNGHSTLISLYKINKKPEKVKKFIHQIERFAIVYFIANKTKIIKKDLAKINKILHEKLPTLEDIPTDLDPSDYKEYTKQQDKKIDSTYKEFVKLISQLTKKYADEFETALISTYFAKSGKRYKQATYMLSIMAKKIGGGNYPIESPNTTIEHIMPWVDDLNHYSTITESDFKKYKGRMGNLTIINKDFNGELGSKSFKEKISLISSAKIDYLTLSLVDSDFNNGDMYSKYRKKFDYQAPKNWEIENIKKRTEALARLARYIWVEEVS